MVEMSKFVWKCMTVTRTIFGLEQIMLTNGGIMSRDGGVESE